MRVPGANYFGLTPCVATFKETFWAAGCGRCRQPRRGVQASPGKENSKAKVNMRETEEAYVELGSDVVLLVGESAKGSTGGGMRPRIGEGVVRRLPPVLVERQILHPCTSQSQIRSETMPPNSKPQITDRKRVVTNAGLGSRIVRPDAHASANVAIVVLVG